MRLTMQVIRENVFEVLPIRYRFAYSYERLFRGLWKMIVFTMKVETDIARTTPPGIRIEYFIESSSQKRV